MRHTISVGVVLGVFLVLLLLALVFARSVGAAPVFPPMVGGDFQFKVQAVTPLDGDGVPTDPITRSVSIVPQDGGSRIVCTDTPDPNGVYEFTAAVAATGIRQAFKAFAYSEVACGGDVSGASENTAYTYPGMSPRPPDLQ